MKCIRLSSYSPQFKGLPSWKQARIREKAAAAQEAYIRKNSYSSNKINVASKHHCYRKPKHPDPCTPGWEDDLQACREFANSLERPDPWSGDYHERLAEWKEYSKYRTKK